MDNVQKSIIMAYKMLHTHKNTFAENFPIWSFWTFISYLQSGTKFNYI